MQKRIPSALPRIAASTFAVFGVAVLIAAGLTASTQPAAAQQGFGNFFSYQGPPKKRVVRKRQRAGGRGTGDRTDAGGGRQEGSPREGQPQKSGPKGAGVRRHLAIPTSSIQSMTPRPHRAHARIDRPGGSPHADRRVQRHRQEPLAPLEHLLAARRCRGCSASPGRASPCTPASCPAIRLRTVASAFPPASPRRCSA